MRKKLLATSVSLTIGGLAGLGLVTNDTISPPPRFVSPTYGSILPDTFDTLTGSTTTTGRRHGKRTLVGGEFIDVPRGLPPGTTTTGPQPDPATQVDVAVPAAGAQVSAGQGPGSCTDVAITALTPDNCPPPNGSGPVVVDPNPASGNIVPGLGGGKSGFVMA